LRNRRLPEAHSSNFRQRLQYQTVSSNNISSATESLESRKYYQTSFAKPISLFALKRTLSNKLSH